MLKANFVSDTGEPVTIWVDASEEYLKTLFIFKSGDTEVGNIYCIWDLEASLRWVSTQYQSVAHRVHRQLMEVAPQAQIPEEDEITEWFSLKGAVAQARLISSTSDVFKEFIAKFLTDSVESLFDVTLTYKAPDGREMQIPLYSPEVKKKLRKEFEKKHRAAHHKRIGVQRGGDRRSRVRLTEEKKTKLRARKAELTSFWRYLCSEFEKHDYAGDLWDWLRERSIFQEELSKYAINDLAVVDELIPEVLKRRPYFLRETSEKMPESLSPAAFAQLQACLEMEIAGSYDAIKKTLNRRK